MLVLGLETSCDETAVALVTHERRILAQRIFSQTEDHRDFGGVVPEIAARAHLMKLGPLCAHLFQEAALSLEDIDLVTATIGPGLIGGLVVGATYAKTLAQVLGIPFVGVNHLAGHALTPRLTHDIPYPYGVLLASGGHSQLLIARGPTAFELLGTTMDDALGECFDKSAKLLGLGHPGGPALERAAARGDATRFDLPRPLLGKSRATYGMQFSLSGLKTAVRDCAMSLPQPLRHEDTCDLAACVQSALADIVASRVNNFLTHTRDDSLTHFIAAGGVAANKAIRRRIEEVCHQHQMPFIAPPPHLCTDNAAMIAWAGYEAFMQAGPTSLSTRCQPRWPLTQLNEQPKTARSTL